MKCDQLLRGFKRDLKKAWRANIGTIHDLQDWERLKEVTSLARSFLPQGQGSDLLGEVVAVAHGIGKMFAEVPTGVSK